MTQTVYFKPTMSKAFSSVVAGTNKGELWTILHPFKDEGANKQLVHTGPVSRLAQTTDQQVLFSAGEDGTLFVFTLVEEQIAE